MAAEDSEFKEVAEKPKVNLNPKGKSGTFVSSFIVEDDYLSLMNGPEAQAEFHKMSLSDSQIRKIIHAVNNPLKSATWSIEPASEETKDIEIAALMEQIIFKDIPEGFKSKLDEILTFPWQGHAVFEVIHKNYNDKTFGSYTGLANLAYRDQRTLDKWYFSRDGVLEKIHQLQQGDIAVNEDMDATTLLIFYNEKKGNDTGYPFLRMLYGNYKRKLLYKQLQAIGMEKGAIGVPKLTLPPSVDYDSDEFDEATEQLEAYTQAESGYIILPDGYQLELDQSSTFDPQKVQTAIKAENEEIVGSLVAMFLEMGIGGNSGNQAGVNASMKFFTDGIEYLADKIADKFNLELIKSLVALNYGDTVEVMPKLVHSGIADEAGKEIMEIITGYVEKGVIAPDEQLEDHVRKSHNLPKKAEGEMLDNKEAEDEVTNNDDDKKDIDNDPAPDDDRKPEPKKDEEDKELSSKASKSPKALITSQAEKISDDIREAIDFASGKYIHDVIARYKQLPQNKKQKATDKTKIGGVNKFKKDLKRSLSETVNLSIAMARKEVPSQSSVELNSTASDIIRMTTKFGDIAEVKLNDFSELPAHAQILVAKQADLISQSSMDDLKKRLDFKYSSMETKSSDEAFIKQAMEDEAKKFSESNQVNIKGTNGAALMVNEGRSSFFFNDDVLDEIHSFTFVNISPVSAICRELAGTTFNTNDAQSLTYHPPLHHNCKSYLRANLKSSKGTDSLEVSSLSPSAKAKESITL